MVKNKYKTLDRKIRNIEKQLEPILSIPLNPETAQSDQLVVEDLHNNLHFMNKLLSLEKASSDEPRHLIDIVKRVRVLRKAVRNWTEGRPLTPPGDSGGSSPCSFIGSCVTDDDSGYSYTREVTSAPGFMVYDNPLFIGDPGDEDDDSIIDEVQVEEIDKGEEEDVTGAEDQGEERESETETEPEPGSGNERVEKEVIRVDYQTEENNEKEVNGQDDDNEEEGRQNCCCKVIFWVMIILMGVTFVMVDLSAFPDDQPSVMFLTPT